MLIAALVLGYSLAAHAGHPDFAKSTPGSYRASARVGFTLVARGKTVGCDAHTSGARAIAEQYAKSSGGKVTAFGSSRIAAERSLASAVAVFVRSTNLSLLREEALYERITQRGAAQDQAALYRFPSGAGCGHGRDSKM
ncbi:MAG: hypothetical protein ABI182_09210 [Candidatus Baltobacteraceae bacterium]